MKKMKKRSRIILIFVICVVVAAGAVLGGVGIWYYTMMYPAAPVLQEGVIRIACVGDSLTYGYGIKDRKHNSYPAQLQALLGDDYQVLNYGLSRRSLQKDVKKPNTSYVNEDFYEISQQSAPDIVIIAIGSNDTRPDNWNAANYEKELEEFVRVYQNLDSAPVVYLMLPPPFYEHKTPHSNEILSNELIPIITRVGAKTDVVVIDLHTPLTGVPELFQKDGLHPTAEGATIIATTVYESLVDMFQPFK